MSLVLCIDNTGYEASLELHKLYQQTDDIKSEKLGFIRVIDETGEDYLYAKKHFYQLPQQVAQTLSHAITLT